MKTGLILISMIMLYSCASQKSSNVDFDDIRNEDFRKRSLFLYKISQDYYEKKDDAQIAGFASETLYLDVGELEKGGDLGQVFQRCYSGDFEEAFDLSDRIHPEHRKNPTYWNAIGNCYLLQKKYLKAILYYNKSNDLVKLYPPAMNNLGVIYLHKGDDQKALVAFKKALTGRGNFVTPAYNLSLLYLRYGLMDKAKAILGDLHIKNPQDRLIGSAYISTLKSLNEKSTLNNICKKMEKYRGDDKALDKNCM